MAKIIHTPTIRRNSRRALPVTQTEQSQSSDADSDQAAAEARPVPVTIDPRDFQRLQTDRDACQRRAEAAEQKLNEIEKQLKSLRREAQEAGHKEGLDKATTAGLEQHNFDQAQLKSVCDQLLAQHKQRIGEAEQAAVEIAFAATVKLLGQVHTDAKLLESLVRQAMKQVLAREGIKIFLSPVDCERMQALVQNSDQEWAGIEFESDSRILMGGCRIESRAGSLDARLDRQMAELKRVLLRRVGKSRAGGD